MVCYMPFKHDVLSDVENDEASDIVNKIMSMLTVEIVINFHSQTVARVYSLFVVYTFPDIESNRNSTKV